MKWSETELSHLNGHDAAWRLWSDWEFVWERVANDTVNFVATKDGQWCCGFWSTRANFSDTVEAVKTMQKDAHWMDIKSLKQWLDSLENSPLREDVTMIVAIRDHLGWPPFRPIRPKSVRRKAIHGRV
jgi:hypothetical protein